MPAANASASALVRKRAYRMAVSFSSAPRGRSPAVPPCLVSGGRSADITAGAEVWFRAAGASVPLIPAHSASLRAFTPVFDGLWTRVNALMLGIPSRVLGLWVPATGSPRRHKRGYARLRRAMASRGAPRGDERMFYVALIVDLGDDDAGRGIDQQQAVVDDHVSVRAYGRHRGAHRLGHRRERVSIANPRADGIGIGGAGGWIDDALARHRRRRNRLGHDPLPHDRPASAPLRNDRAIDRGALGGRERKRRRAHRRLIGARLVGGRLVGPRLVVARLVTRLIDPRPGHIRLINPGLRARRHRRGNERYRQACGADIRPHGDLLCQLGEALA